MDGPRVATWEQRFRAPTLTLPTWSRQAPDRLAMGSNESGSWQVHAWDRATGHRRRVTDHRIGVADATVTADGSGVVWFHDETGGEHGRFVVAPFGGGEASPLFPGLPDGWPSGLSLGRRVSAVGLSLRDGFVVYAVPRGGDPWVLFRHSERAEVGGADRGGVSLAGLSADERLVCVAHCEHGDNLHPALRVYDVATGEVAGELWDGEGLGLTAWAWSPIPGDQRLALVHERDDLERPAVWDLATGERRDLRLALPGPVAEVFDWWPDGSALLLNHTHEGRSRLHRLDLVTGAVTPIEHPEGTVDDARVRPDGSVWFRHASGASQPRILSDAGEEVLAPEGPRAPEGRPYRSWWFENPRGQRVHGFLVTPPGAGPFPLLMDVHGGPHWLWLDAFHPAVQAWVDHGLAVALVNYRGSTGYGRSWRDAIVGNPGFTELEDLMAGLDALVARGVADPERVVLGGVSWGGYLTLLGIGLYPDRFAAAVAEVPVGDYLAAYEDEAPALQAFDRGLFGAGPETLAERYRERSPITYADRVKVPLFVTVGEHDSRCPPRQVDNYLAALRRRGHPVEAYRFDAGHGSLVVDERVRQMRAKLDFVLRHVPGLRRPGESAT